MCGGCVAPWEWEQVYCWHYRIGEKGAEKNAKKEFTRIGKRATTVDSAA
jgi:hypothetical protein